jgi:hypothetical protein
MRILLALVALSVAGSAFAATDSEAERQKISLVLDFCASVVAQGARGAADADHAYDALASRLPGLTLGPPKLLSEQIPEPIIRETFRKVFNVEDTEELRFAAFTPSPSARKIPYAAFKPDGEICLVVGPPNQEGSADSLLTRLSANGSPWSAKSKEGDSQLWERAAPLGETITLGLSGDEMMIFMALAQRPVATREEIAAIASATLTPCVEAILNASPPAARVFDPAFTVVETHPAEKTPGLVHTTLRSQVAGPRSMLTFNTYKEFVYCELWTSDVRQPADQVLAAVVDTITALPGIKETKVKVAKAAPDADVTPVLRSWRVTRRGAARKADISIGVREQNIVVVSIEHSTGWFW